MPAIRGAVFSAQAEDAAKQFGRDIWERRAGRVAGGGTAGRANHDGGVRGDVQAIGRQRTLMPKIQRRQIYYGRGLN